MHYDTPIKSFRTMFANIDTGIYSLISGAYQVFFNVANASIIDSDLISKLFGRIQLIFGVIVLFRLAISLIGGIVNPDSFSNEKTGFGKIITRVVISLLLAVVIIPLNITGDFQEGSTEQKIRDNGILFGLMYDFQDRVISRNVIGNLILGNSQMNYDYNKEKLSANKEYEKYGTDLAKNLLHSFYSINLTTAAKQKVSDDPSVATADFYGDSDNRLAKGADNDAIVKEVYKDACGDAEDGTSCSLSYLLNEIATAHGSLDSDDGKYEAGDYFVWDYKVFISSICGIAVLVMLLGFTIDIAIRAFKLIILRIVAIVPIVSYIDPKSDKTLSTWAEFTLKTYIDIFLRVGIMYIVVLIVDGITKRSDGATLFPIMGGSVGAFSYLFLILGLFFFAKEAPKFIMESMGMKPGNFFQNVGRFLTVAGVAGSGLVGGVAGAITGFRASQAASRANAPIGSKKWRQGNPLKASGAAAWNALSGFAGNAHAFGTAKNHKFSAARHAAIQRNSELMADGMKGVTAWSRFTGNIGDYTGSSVYQNDKRLEYDLKRQQEAIKHQMEARQQEIAMYKGKQDAIHKLTQNVVGGDIIKDGKNARGTTEILDTNGHKHRIDYAYDDWYRKTKNLKPNEKITLKDSNGHEFEVSAPETARVDHVMHDTATGYRIAEQYQDFLNGNGSNGVSDNIQALRSSGILTAADTLQLNKAINSGDSQAVFDVFDKIDKAQFHNISVAESIGDGKGKGAGSLNDLQKQNEDLENQLFAVRERLSKEEAATSHNRTGGPGGGH